MKGAVESKAKVALDASTPAKKDRLSGTERRDKEACALPAHLEFSLEVSGLGCWRLALSPDGLLLAAACGDDSFGEVRIFHLGTGKLKATCTGIKVRFTMCSGLRPGTSSPAPDRTVWATCIRW